MKNLRNSSRALRSIVEMIPVSEVEVRVRIEAEARALDEAADEYDNERAVDWVQFVYDLSVLAMKAVIYAAFLVRTSYNPSATVRDGMKWASEAMIKIEEEFHHDRRYALKGGREHGIRVFLSAYRKRASQKDE